MLYSVPLTNEWLSHLNERVNIGKELGFLKNVDNVIVNNAKIFLPSGLDAAVISNMKISDSLNILLNKNVSDGWSKRMDMLEDASEWFYNEYNNISNSLIACEASYSKVGDRILDDREYFVFNGRPILYKNIACGANKISAMLRYGRSQRIIGTVITYSKSASTEFSYAGRQCFFVMHWTVIQ